jgi:hypothetical protein
MDTSNSVCCFVDPVVVPLFFEYLASGAGVFIVKPLRGFDKKIFGASILFDKHQSLPTLFGYIAPNFQTYD